MRNNNSTVYAFLLIIGDFIALLAAFIVAYIIRVSYDPRPLVNQVSATDYLKIWFTLVPIWIVIFALIGLYKRSNYEYRYKEFGGIIVGALIGIMTVISYDFVAKVAIFPARLVAVYGFFIGIAFLFIERTIMRFGRTSMWRYGKGVNNVMIIGQPEVVVGLIKVMNRPAKTGYKVVAVCTPDDSISYRGKVFNSLEEALQNLSKYCVHTILHTGITSDTDSVDKALSAAQANHIAFKFVPAHEGILSNNIEVELFQNLPVVTVHQTALTGWGRAAKRIFDLFAAGVGILVLSLLFVLIAVLVRFTNWGPAIFKQKRLSRFNAPIYIYKFRTLKMTYNGLSPEEGFTKMGKPHLIEKYRNNGDFLKNDPRLTKFGKFLRKTSLDELPQLLNIFKGDISLVGPRALVPQELENYPFKNLILSVKSGLTGLAQISGRRDITFEERRALDLYYVQNWSFWLDIKIIFRTFIDVIKGRGAK
jgi:exopolysaccharide biosynthesis polyprenyl glycosylphosphotransferase